MIQKLEKENMTNGDNRLQTAHWIFERQLSWIAAAEVKVGVLVALNTGMLGGASALPSVQLT